MWIWLQYLCVFYCSICVCLICSWIRWCYQSASSTSESRVTTLSSRTDELFWFGALDAPATGDRDRWDVWLISCYTFALTNEASQSDLSANQIRISLFFVSILQQNSIPLDPGHDLQIVPRQKTADQPVTWTGLGLVRVLEGVGLRFTVDNLPSSMDYQLVIRYEPEVRKTVSDLTSQS